MLEFDSMFIGSPFIIVVIVIIITDLILFQRKFPESHNTESDGCKN